MDKKSEIRFIGGNELKTEELKKSLKKEIIIAEQLESKGDTIKKNEGIVDYVGRNGCDENLENEYQKSESINTCNSREDDVIFLGIELPEPQYKFVNNISVFCFS